MGFFKDSKKTNMGMPIVFMYKMAVKEITQND